MNTEIQTLYGQIKELSLIEQLQLTELISSYVRQQLLTSSLSNSKTIKQLAAEQNSHPITDLSMLASTMWPEEESLDDFLEFVHISREEDHQLDSMRMLEL